MDYVLVGRKSIIVVKRLIQQALSQPFSIIIVAQKW